MTLERKIAATFDMTGETWARHANPWSVWTRFLLLPLFVLAIWSRVWLGWWALVPVTVLALWTWLNPRFFPRPRSTDNWASKAVLGERVWLNRDNIPVPQRHRRAPNLLSGIAAAGMIFVFWGLIALALWPTLLGLVAVYFGKMWFLDRMVWLYEDMKNTTPEYRSWLYGPEVSPSGEEKRKP